MKGSNSRNATPEQYLEYLRERRGIEHARYMRDKLGWRWRPSVIYWTVRLHWFSWVVAAGSVMAWFTDIASGVQGLLR
jgi:hypothetical protein